MRTCFRPLATLPPGAGVPIGGRRAWDDPRAEPLRRRSRDADASLVDPNALSDRRSVTPGTVDATDRSACCSARRDGIGRPTEASAAEP